MLTFSSIFLDSTIDKAFGMAEKNELINMISNNCPKLAKYNYSLTENTFLLLNIPPSLITSLGGVVVGIEISSSAGREHEGIKRTSNHSRSTKKESQESQQSQTENIQMDQRNKKKKTIINNTRHKMIEISSHWPS